MKTRKNTKPTTGMRQKVVTIPNILSMFRIALIPLIVWAYHIKGEYQLAGGLIIASGATDVLDGLIARRFHMVSDLGKALDPFADKLTQTAILVCLLPRFPLMWIPLCLLVVKEFISCVWKIRVILKTKIIECAKWHGKVTTVLLYAMLLLHIFWPEIPSTISMVSIILCTAMMLLSFLLYSIGNYELLKESIM